MGDRPRPEASRCSAELTRLTRGALAEMRTLLLELRPSALVEANLGDLLRRLAESVSGRTGIPVTVVVDGSRRPISQTKYTLPSIALPRRR